MNERLLIPALRFPVDEDACLGLAERGVGGFCVFSAPANVGQLLRRLQDVAPHPLLIAADLEEGAGQQIEGLSRHPCAAALDPDAAEAAGARTALEARPHGVTMTFAPVCDVVSNPQNPIVQGRAFLDPAACAPRFIEGARRFGLRTCAKHFPGHGATSLDSHDALPIVQADAEVWHERDLPPFAVAIDAGVDAIMTAHIACPGLTGSPDLPATLSRRVMHDLLRGEMGFSGLVVTDALLMEGVLVGRTEAEAAVASVEAGCDAVLCPDDLEGVLNALQEVDAEASLERIAAASAPLDTALERAAAATVKSTGPLPVGPGPHPLQIHDLSGEGEALAVLSGVRYERYGPDGEQLSRGGETGLEAPCLAVLRRDTAWGGPLALPPAVRAAAEGARLLILIGPEGLAAGLDAPARVLAPGGDPATLREVVRRAFALN